MDGVRGDHPQNRATARRRGTVPSYIRKKENNGMQKTFFSLAGSAHIGSHPRGSRC